jgi:hypothetical protein
VIQFDGCDGKVPNPTDRILLVTIRCAYIVHAPKFNGSWTFPRASVRELRGKIKWQLTIHGGRSRPIPDAHSALGPVGACRGGARCGTALRSPSTHRHISRRRAPMSTGATGRSGIPSGAQCAAAVRQVKRPRTSSGRKRERGAITWPRPWRCWCVM